MCVCMCAHALSDDLKLSPQPRSRVVVVKYDRKPLSNKTLFAFTEPFGVLREHLVLKNKVCQSTCLGGGELKKLILELL